MANRQDRISNKQGSQQSPRQSQEGSDGAKRGSANRQGQQSQGDDGGVREENGRTSEPSQHGSEKPSGQQQASVPDASLDVDNEASFPAGALHPSK